MNYPLLVNVDMQHPTHQYTANPPIVSQYNVTVEGIRIEAVFKLTQFKVSPEGAGTVFHESPRSV